jgi:hypothetical protein
VRTLLIFISNNHAVYFCLEVPGEWSHGNLIHYGRAELKQSDHRPVIAIIDVDILQVNEDRRSEVFMEVMQDLGPPDATIVVQVSRILKII